jgi:hypothetical protein
MKIHVPILNKTRKNCFRYLKLMSPLNAAICTTTYLERQKCYGPGKKILFKFFLFDLEVKGHYSMWHTALWSCTHIPNKYYLKNNYLTLRSKIKVPRRSLWYATHRLMVMHPHTKYNWLIWKDKKVMVRTSFAEKKQKKKSD